VKLGYHWQREVAPLFSNAVLPDPSSLHVVDQYLDVARAAGASSEAADFGLAPKDEDRDAMKELLKSSGVAGPFVLLNAGAGWATKRWSPAHFGTLAEMLAAKGISSVLIGGKATADVEAAEQVVSTCPVPVVNLLGKTSVRELVALVSPTLLLRLVCQQSDCTQSQSPPDRVPMDKSIAAITMKTGSTIFCRVMLTKLVGRHWDDLRRIISIESK
jgi:heptosyltransferase I